MRCISMTSLRARPHSHPLTLGECLAHRRRAWRVLDVASRPWRIRTLWQHGVLAIPHDLKAPGAPIGPPPPQWSLLGANCAITLLNPEYVILPDVSQQRGQRGYHAERC